MQTDSKQENVITANPPASKFRSGSDAVNGQQVKGNSRQDIDISQSQEEIDPSFFPDIRKDFPIFSKTDVIGLLGNNYKLDYEDETEIAAGTHRSDRLL